MKGIKLLADWLNDCILDCVLWLEKNEGHKMQSWYEGYRASLEATLSMLEVIYATTKPNKKGS